jgi:hypothetical protein
MDRHWFPAILLGFSVLLALAFAAVLSPQGQDVLQPRQAVEEVIAPATVITEDVYQTAVTNLLQTYATEQDSQATYDALIALRVPGTMLNLHYELVIAFGKLLTDDRDDAQARLAALKAQYSWLPL